MGSVCNSCIFIHPSVSSTATGSSSDSVTGIVRVGINSHHLKLYKSIHQLQYLASGASAAYDQQRRYMNRQRQSLMYHMSSYRCTTWIVELPDLLKRKSRRRWIGAENVSSSSASVSSFNTSSAISFCNCFIPFCIISSLQKVSLLQ